MKSARPLSEPSATEPAHDNTAEAVAETASRFVGTENPRHLRVLQAFLRRPMPREHIDGAAGCSNGPALVAELRARGLQIPCERAPVIDRDGQEVRRGIYRLSPADRRRIGRWLREREEGRG